MEIQKEIQVLSLPGIPAGSFIPVNAFFFAYEKTVKNEYYG
jgi:hypothetical protein